MMCGVTKYIFAFLASCGKHDIYINHLISVYLNCLTNVRINF